MRRLIVTADDLGADAGRNAGIFRAVASGSATSVSLLPNGPALEDALREMRSFAPGRVSAGVHFNLSEGKPLASGHGRLAGPGGFFHGKAAAQRLLLHPGGAALRREIREELSAQMRRILESGIAIDHADGHQHIHVFPAVFEIAAELAAGQGIPGLRVPVEAPPVSRRDSLRPGAMEEAALFSRQAAAAGPHFRALGIRTADHFRGLYLKGRLPADDWDGFLRELPPGLTELMVHPGCVEGKAPGPFAGFSTAERESELAALTDGRFRAALLRSGVALVAFPRI